MAITKLLLQISILVFLGIISCQKSTQNKVETPLERIDSTNLTGNNNKEQEDTIDYKKNSFPSEKDFTIKVLVTGSFHSDEVWESASKEKWFGLFTSDSGFYLAETKLITSRVHDYVGADAENEKTGWKIETSIKDKCLILIESQECLINRKVEQIHISGKEIYPSDTLQFSYLGIDYGLYATGKKEKFKDSDDIGISNYSLYLTGLKNGKTITELLSKESFFEDEMVDVIFAGDIDGDGLIDLILDTSSNYNVSSPTLYLSKPANQEHLIKPMGGHTSVGC